MKPVLLLFLMVTGAAMSACGEGRAPGDAGQAPAAAPAAREIDWLELLPPGDLEALRDDPPVNHDLPGPMSRAPREWGVVDALDGVEGTMAGYIVPLDSTEDGRLASFFLVPYFGACIHVPPPPPNQLVYGKLEQPIAMTDLYAPYRVRGTLRIERSRERLGESAYTLHVRDVSVWKG